MTLLRGRGLAVRLAVAFAAVAVGTAAAVAIAAPPIVGRGFAMMEAGVTPGGMGRGPGVGPDPSAAATYYLQAQQEATTTIVIVALAAAAVASLIGILIAWRIARPLVRLEHAAAAVAAGDLAARSGVADRGDEVGSLGRSFDAMAADLERSEAARRRFFADAAHEMKTPLAVIEATSSAVLDGVYAHDDRHLETIQNQARLLARVVDDLRTVSLAEAGALPLQIATVRPSEVVASVVAAFSARAAAAGIAIETTFVRTGDTTVRADRDRLAQVVGIFLDNAIRLSPGGGTIAAQVDASPAGPRLIRISILDEGPGVAAVDLPHIFERFYQADEARDRGTTTSGLGLAIAKAVIEAQGGRVGAGNGATGGATFWLDLPEAA